MKSDLEGKVIKIRDSKYRVIEKLYESSHSTVYEGFACDTKSKVAIKHLSFQKTNTVFYEAYVKEVAILEEIESHQNIVKLIDKREAVNNMDMDAILIFEFCQSNLQKIVDRRKQKSEVGLPEQFILKILFDISKALKNLHLREPPIIHRDVRLANIMLGEDGNYKLGSFSTYSKIVYDKIDEDEIPKIKSEIKNSTSPLYRAPEQLDLYSGFPINEKLDSWCFGITLY